MGKHCNEDTKKATGMAQYRPWIWPHFHHSPKTFLFVELEDRQEKETGSLLLKVLFSHNHETDCTLHFIIS